MLSKIAAAIFLKSFNSPIYKFLTISKKKSFGCYDFLQFKEAIDRDTAIVFRDIWHISISYLYFIIIKVTSLSKILTDKMVRF